METSKEYILMSTEEQKKVMLKILCEFSEFCETHGLEYFLDAGTLLGAVRHKGYIPWDDDIDVNMPRASYDRFCNIIKQNKGRLSLHLFVEFPEDTIFPFLKIADDRTILIEYPDKNPMEVAVYIDVFPKDGIKNDSLKSKIVCDVSYYLNLLRWFNVYSIYAWKNDSNYVKRLIAALGRMVIRWPNVPLKLQKEWINRYSKRNPLEKCTYVTTLVNGEFSKRAPKKCFESSIKLEFEGCYFTAPKDYDAYLKCLYSNTYMEIPPLEKRIKHDNIIFWKNEEARSSFLKELI